MRPETLTSAADPALLTPEELRRYRRQLILPEVGSEGQQRLKRASVLCVGAGGLGSPLALYLAAAGVGRLGLVDDDTVDASNLHRQILHDGSFLGKPKLESAAARLSALNPGVRVEAHRTRLTASNALGLIRDYDVVADGSDNFPTRYALNDACALAGKPDVFGSVHRFDGQVSVFWADRGPCLRCLHPEPPPPDAAPSCAESGVLGAIPGIIGALQALEVLKLILSAGRPLIGRLALFDGLALEWRTLKLRKDPACPSCAKTPNLKETAMPPIPEISVEDLKTKLDRKEKFILLDVREPHEYEMAKIPGSLLMPLGSVPQRFGELDKAQPIIVHCRSGARSAKAVQFLREKGYDAVNVAGGILAWAERIDPSVPTY